MNTVWIVLPVLIALMFQLGIELDRQAFAGVARRPAAVVAGLLGQLALLPLIAFGVGLAFRLPPVYFLGLLLVACCPGGSSSNVFSMLAKGDVALSVTLTALSSLITLFTIPLVMGFGCNVPAIMATRTIESRSSRLITVLLVPFMSCSARIPIYILLIGTFFAAYASWVMLGLYLLGIVVAVITARLMRRYLFKKDETPFVMELPPYRVPTMRATLSHMWDRCAQYLRKMGGLILVASVAVWFLSYYPTPDAAAPAETTEEHYENSYLGQVGQACSPVFEPLGLNWKASIAILTGLPAKEIVVSTLGVLYSEQGDAPEAELDSPTLSQRLVASGDFTPASVLAFLVFILLYLPCIATIVAIAAEIGWRWACISVLYNTALAWIMAYLTYHLFSWL